MKTTLATAASGVNYSALDKFKRLAQACAARTNGDARRLGLEFAPWSRGESAAIFDILPGFDVKRIGFCHEGLGTKNLVADAYRKEGRRGAPRRSPRPGRYDRSPLARGSGLWATLTSYFSRMVLSWCGY